MIRSRTGMLAFVVALAITTALPVRAQDSAAELAPQDTMAWFTANGDACQYVLSFLALPPVAKMVDARLNAPFAHVNTVLGLADGTFESAAPHLTGISFATLAPGPDTWDPRRGDPDDAMVVVVSFDDARWPKALLQGTQETEEPGVSTLSIVGENIFIAPAGKHVLLGPGSGTVAHCAKGDYAQLASNPAWTKAAEAAGDSLAWGWMAIPQFIDMALEEVPDRDRPVAATAIDTLGLRHLTGALLTAAQTDSGLELKATITTDGERTGVLALLPTDNPALAGDVPADAALAVILNWGDPKAAFGGGRELATKIDRQINGDRAQLQMGFAMLEGLLGVPFNDFLAQLGTGIAAYVPHPGDDGMLARDDWAVVLGLADGEAFTTTYRTVLQATMGQPPAPFEHDGTTMFRVPMTPLVMTIQPEKLVLGLSAEAVKRHLDWTKSGAAALKLDRPGLIEHVHADFGLLMHSYPKPEPGLNFSWMAEFRDDTITGTLRIEAPEGTFGLPAIAQSGALGAALLTPALFQARKQAQLVTDKANLHNIALAIATYREVHDGNYPPNFKVLYDGGHLDRFDLFVSPADKHPRRVAGVRTSYVYIGTPLPRNLHPSIPLVYTRTGVFPGQRNVAFVDHSVATAIGDNVSPRMKAQDAYDQIVRQLGEAATDERKKELRQFFMLDE